MTRASSITKELLAKCDSLGIRLLPACDGGLTIDAPTGTLTQDLLGLVKAHKVDLLAMLRTTAPAVPAPASEAPAKPARAVCRCGSTIWQDVPIHCGQSVRRDCGRCGRFLAFLVWYGKNTLHYEQ